MSHLDHLLDAGFVRSLLVLIFLHVCADSKFNKDIAFYTGVFFLLLLIVIIIIMVMIRIMLILLIVIMITHFAGPEIILAGPPNNNSNDNNDNSFRWTGNNTRMSA